MTNITFDLSTGNIFLDLKLIGLSKNGDLAGLDPLLLMSTDCRDSEKERNFSGKLEALSSSVSLVLETALRAASCLMKLNSLIKLFWNPR